MSILDIINDIPVENSTPMSKDVRTKRSNDRARHLTASGFVVEQLARIAVETGVVRVIDGRLHIRNRKAMSPLVLENIDMEMADVVRIVGEIERSREYGDCYADVSGITEDVA